MATQTERRVQLPEPIEVAKAAWETAPHGRSELMGHGVVKDNKIVLVVPPPEKRRLALIAFPHPAHMPKFAQASNGVMDWGPAWENPGAIGTLTLITSHSRGNPLSGLRLTREIRGHFPGLEGRHFELEAAQSHFKAVSTQNPGLWRLPRALATRYGGWRKRALDEMVRISANAGMPILIPTRNNSFYPFFHEPDSKSKFRDELRGAAEKFGARVLTNPEYWVIAPKAPVPVEATRARYSPKRQRLLPAEKRLMLPTAPKRLLLPAKT